jgi:VCBS repeat-containing protein
MSSVVAIVKSIVGQVIAISPEGIKRVLIEGDHLLAGERIETGASGAVSLQLADGRVLDVGRDSQWSAANPQVSTQVGEQVATTHAPSAEELQQAIANGVDPTKAFEAPAAGNTAPTEVGPGGEAGGGHSFVVLDATAARVDPTIGFNTAGLGDGAGGTTEQSADTTPLRASTLTISATDSVAETGGVVTYTATVTQAPVSPLTVTLSNGQVITIAAGQLTGSVNVTFADANDAYINAHTVTVSVTGTSGGQGLVITTDPAPAVTTVTDTIDPTQVTITAPTGTVTEGTSVTYTISVANAPQTNLVLTLSDGNTVTIEAGKTSVDYTVNVGDANHGGRADDIYAQGTTTTTLTVTGVSNGANGNLESVVTTGATVTTSIVDNTTETQIGFSAHTASVNEGAAATYTVNVPTTTAPLTLTLSYSGTAVPGADVTPGSSNVTFSNIVTNAETGITTATVTVVLPAGQNSFTLGTLSDNLLEGTEGVTLTLTGVTGGGLENPTVNGALSTVSTDIVDQTVPTATGTGGDTITGAGGDSVVGSEDTPVNLTWSNFNVQQAAPGETPDLGVKITSIPNGTLVLTVNGVSTTIVAGDIITKAQLDSGSLVFTPAANAASTGTGAGSVQDLFGAIDFQPVNNATSANPILGAQASIGLVIDAVADTPALNAPATVTGSEDSSIAITGITTALLDTDGSETLTTTASGLPVGSVITYTDTNGNTVTKSVDTAGATVDISDANLATLAVTPPSNYNSTVNGDIQLTISSYTTESSNGSASTPATQTVTLVVNAVNDAPTIEGAGTHFSEGTLAGQGSVAIVQNLVIADTADSNTTMSSAKVVISGLQAGDVITSALTAADGTAVNGITVTHVLENGVDTWTLSGNASIAEYTALIESIKLVNDTVTPNATPRSVEITVTDADGTPLTNTPDLSATYSGTITVNDAPIAGNATGNTGNEDNLVSINLGATDANGTVASFTLTNVTDLLTHGKLYANADGTGEVKAGDVIAAVNNGATLYFQPTANWSGSATISYSATDNEGLASRTSVTDNVTVIAVADTPVVLAPAAITGNEDSSIAITGVSASLVDTDGSESLTTSVSGLPAGSVLTYTDTNGNTVSKSVDTTGASIDVSDANLATLAVTPPANYNSQLNGDISLTISSYSTESSNGAQSTPASQTITLTVTPVNDAPTVSIDDGSVRFTENGGAVALVNGVQISDAADQNVNMSKATVVVDGTQAGDCITSAKFVSNYSEDANGVISGQTAEGITVTRSGSVAEGFTYTLSGAGTIEQYKALIESFTFNNTEANPISTDRTVSLTLTDAGGTDVTDVALDSKTATSTLTVNDAPIAQATPDSGNEDTLIAVQLSGTDSNAGGSVASFTIAAQAAHGTFFADAAGTQALDLSQAIAATSNSATVYFKPDANWSGDTTFSYTATDNEGVVSTVPATPTISVVAVADAAIISTFPSVTTQTFTGDAVSSIVGSGSGASAQALVDALNKASAAGNATTTVPGTADFAKGDIPVGLATKIDAQVFLEAGKTYTFTGTADDSFALTINGQVVATSQSGSWQVSGSYTATASGYYDLSMYHFNQDGAGYYGVLVNDGTSGDVALGSSGLVVDPVALSVGAEDSVIKLTPMTIVFPDTDGSETHIVTLKGMPEGTTVTDASGHSGVADAAGNLVITGWDSSTLSLQAPANYNGSFTVTVLAESTEQSNSDYASSSAPLYVTVTPVNDAPVVDLNGAAAGTDTTAAYTEHQAAINIAGADFTITDVDTNSTVSSATIKVTNLGAGDLLALDTSSDVAKAAVAAGLTITQSAATGVITITGTATHEVYEGLIKSITFSSNGATADGTRNITVSVNDGTGTANAESNVATLQVAVTAVNDPTVIGHENPSYDQYRNTFTEGDTPKGVVWEITLADPDNTTLNQAVVKITNWSAGDQLAIGTVASDLTVTVSADKGTITISGPGTLAEYQAALQSITYANTSENPNGATREITVAVTDAAVGGNTTSVTAYMNVVPVNDTPVVTFNSTVFHEQQGAQALVTNFAVSDVDNTTMAKAVVTVSNVVASDLLTFAQTAGLDIKIVTDATTNTATITLTSTNGTAGTAISAFESAINSITFNSPGQNPSGNAHNVTIAVTDVGGNTLLPNEQPATGTATGAMTVDLVNDATVIGHENPSYDQYRNTFTEGDTPKGVVWEITLADPDNTTLNQAVVKITNWSAGDQLAIGTVASDLTVTVSADKGTITISGPGTLAEYQAALQSITYANTSENPNGATREITVAVTDAAVGGNTTSVTAYMNVVPVNDTPVVTFNSTVFHEQQGAQALVTNFAVSDVDNTTMAKAVVTVSNVVASDLLTFAQTAGLDIKIVTDATTNTATITLTSTNGTAGTAISAFESAINSITFNSPGQNPSGNAHNVTIAVTDVGGNTLLPNEQPATGTATGAMTVDLVNDAPTASATDATVAEDSKIVGQLQATDPDSGDTLTYTVKAGDMPPGFTVDASGKWTMDASGSTYQHLAVGQTATYTVPFTVTDSSGAQSTSALTLKVTGTNDAPVAQAATATAVEHETLSSPGVVASATDGSALVITFTTTAANQTVSFNWNFKAVDGLPYNDFAFVQANGQAASLLSNVAAVGAGGTSGNHTYSQTYASPGTYQIVVGVADFGDTAVDANLSVSNITGATINSVVSNGSITSSNGSYLLTSSGETAQQLIGLVTKLPVTGQLVATDADDNHTLSFSQTPGSATVAGFSLTSDGKWTFDASNAAYNSLAAGEIKTITIPYTVTDEHGATGASTLTIAVTGTNDAPIATATSKTVAEDTQSTGQLTATDVDNGDKLTYTIDSSKAPVGFTVDSDGKWAFDTSGTTYQSLGVNQSVTYTVPFTVTDKSGATSNSTLTLKVTGANDAPVASVSTGSGAEDSSITGKLQGYDVDNGDVLTYGVKPADMPAGFTLNSATGQWTLDASNQAYQSLGAGQSVTLQVPFTVTDASGANSTSMLSITVNGTNDAPTAVSSTLTGTEDTAIALNWSTFGVNDVDTPVASQGIVFTALPADGVIQYKNAAGDWVTLTAADLKTGSSAGTVFTSTSSLQFVPDAQEASNAKAGNGVGNNLHDYAQLSFQATDGIANSATQTVTIDVNAVADAALLSTSAAITQKTYYFDPDTSVLKGTGSGVSAQVLVDALNSATPSATAAGSSQSYNFDSAAQGYAAKTDGQIYLTAGKTYNFVGSADDSFAVTINGTVVATTSSGNWQISGSFTPTASGYYDISTYYYNQDGGGNTYVYVYEPSSGTVTPLGDAVVQPAALNTGNEDSVIKLSPIVINFPDTDGSESHVVTLKGMPAGTTVTDSNGHSGTADVNGNLVITGWTTSTLSLQAPQDYNGKFTVTVLAESTELSNGSYTSSQITLPEVNVVAVNDAPVASPTSAEGTEDTGLVAGQLQATDIDGDKLTFSVKAADAAPGFVLDSATGKWTVDTSNAAYQSLASGETKVYSVPFTVTDPSGATSTSTLTLTMTGVNDAPVAVATSTAVFEDSTVSGTLLAKDIDNGDVLTYSVKASDTPAGFTLNTATGQWTLDASNAAYQHLAAGQTTTIVVPFTVTDAAGETSKSNLTVVVTGTNDAPVAVNDSGMTVTGLQGNYYGYQEGTDGSNLGTISQALNFVATHAANATFSSSAINYGVDSFGSNLGLSGNLAKFLGTNDAKSLTYTTGSTQSTTSDAIVELAGKLSMAAGTYSLKVTADDGYSIYIDGKQVAAVDKNQSSHTDTFTFSVTGTEDHAIQIVYWDQGGYANLKVETALVTTNGNGTTSIGAYTVLGTDASATVTHSTLSTLEDQPLVIKAAALLQNDYDVDGDTLTIKSVQGSDAAHPSVVTDAAGKVLGAVALDASGNVIFTPAANINGNVSFNYTITDGHGGEATAKVTVNVVPVNDAPTATPVTLAAVDEDHSVTFTKAQLLATASDADGDSLAVVNVQLASGSGTLVANGNDTWTFTPVANWNGPISFTYGVSDGKVIVSNTASGTITAVNDAPTAVNSTVTGAEDSPVTLAWSTFGVSDIDSSSLGIVFTALPANGSIQYLVGSTWVTLTAADLQGGTATKTFTSANSLQFMPAANESSDAGAITGVGNNQHDYAKLSFQATDGNTAANNGFSATKTVTVDISAVADAPTLSVALPTLTSTGLTLKTYVLDSAGKTTFGTGGNGITGSTLTGDINTYAASHTATTTTTVKDFNSAGGVTAGTATEATGLVYLVAGKTYTFSGTADDSFAVTIGGKLAATATWGNNSGAITGSFTPSVSGYYTLDIYHYNQAGPGNYNLQVSVDGATATSLSGSGLITYTSTDDAAKNGVTLSALNGSNGEGFYTASSINHGMENTAITLSKITATFSDNDGSETHSVTLSGLQAYTQISNGTTTLTADAKGNLDITSLVENKAISLTLIPPANYVGTMHVVVSGSSTESSNGSTVAATPVTFDVVVDQANFAPAIDLDLNNSSGATNNDYAVAYATPGTKVSIADTDATITDTQGTGTLSGATITLNSATAGDALAYGALPTGITATTVSSGGNIVVTLSGTASYADYQTAIKAVSYSNNGYDTTSTGAAAAQSTRTVTVTVDDGTGALNAKSAAATTTITVAAETYTTKTGAAGSDSGIYASSANTVMVGDVSGTTFAKGASYNIALILDTSSSMSGSIATVKQQLINVVTQLHDSLTGDNAGKVNLLLETFNTTADKYISIDLSDDTAYHKLLNTIQSLDTSGRTNYEAAFLKASGWFSAVSSSTASNVTYFITDGQPNEVLSNNGSYASYTSASTATAVSEAKTVFDSFVASSNSKVFAIGLNNAVDDAVLLKFDNTDGKVDNNVAAGDLGSAINHSTVATPSGDDTVSGGTGNDILFGDQVTWTTSGGTVVEGAEALRAFVTSATGSATSVSDLVMHQYITDHVSTFNGVVTATGGSLNVEKSTGGGDTLLGGDGNDIIFGQGGGDTMQGGAGNDILLPGSGNNTLWGNSGSDTFMWLKGDTGNNVIKDFSVTEGDKLDLGDLLQTATVTNIADYIKATIDSTGTTLSINSSGKIATAAADVTIHVDNVSWNNDTIKSLVAGTDPTIKVDHH